MELLQTIFTSVITSGIFIAGISWFLKRYFEKRIEFLFQERVKIVETKIKIAEKYEDHLLGVLVNLLPKLQEYLYRCRNQIKEVADKNEQGLLDKAIRRQQE